MVAAEVRAILRFNPTRGKWQVVVGDKVVGTSKTREYLVSAVLDGTTQRMRKHNITKLFDEDGNELDYVSLLRSSSIVKDTDTYELLVKTAMEHRDEIDNFLSGQMSGLRDLFVSLFPIEKKQFTLLKDFMYYSRMDEEDIYENRLEQLFFNLRFVANFYEYLGRKKDIDDLSKRFGIRILKTPMKPWQKKMASIKINTGTKYDWMACFPKKSMPRSKVAIANAVLDKAMEIQKLICGHADAIKITAATIAQEKCGVKKGDFTKAIRVASRVKRTGMKQSSAVYRTKLSHVTQETAITKAMNKNA